MIQNDMLYKPSFNYIKKERFTGSYCGMRYSIQKFAVGEEETVMRCYDWPEPMNFENTPDEKKTMKDFPMTPEGLEECLKYLSERQETY